MVVQRGVKFSQSLLDGRGMDERQQLHPLLPITAAQAEMTFE